MTPELEAAMVAVVQVLALGYSSGLAFGVVILFARPPRGGE